MQGFPCIASQSRAELEPRSEPSHRISVQEELFPDLDATTTQLPDSHSPALPEGFAYQSEFITAEEEQQLLAEISRFDFLPFDFHGYSAKSRIVEYGFEYDFGSRRASETRPIPAFLESLKNRAAAWADIQPQDIVEAVVTEYPYRSKSLNMP